MILDLSQEHLVTLTEASRIIPGSPHFSTLWRWYQRGIRGTRLETVIVGGRRFTSREAIKRFIARTTAARDGHHRQGGCSCATAENRPCDRLAGVLRVARGEKKRSAKSPAARIASLYVRPFFDGS